MWGPEWAPNQYPRPEVKYETSRDRLAVDRRRDGPDRPAQCRRPDEAPYCPVHHALLRRDLYRQNLSQRGQDHLRPENAGTLSPFRRRSQCPQLLERGPGMEE